MDTYGCYDVNGYRFRSMKYERSRSGLTITNSGVCVSSYDGNNDLIEYFGVIEDIIKVSWDGSMQLELVIFECTWFDPTSAGVRRTENLGLVEVKHTSRLSNFDPFVLSSQVTQVYYVPYPCTTRPDLSEWWVVYQVAPKNRLLHIDTSTMANNHHNPVEDMSFFQEDGLDGTFVIDLGSDLENSATVGSNEITNPKDLKRLENEISCDEDSDEDEVHSESSDDGEELLDYEAEDF